MSTRMPNGILSHHHGKQHDDTNRQSPPNMTKQLMAKNISNKNNSANNNNSNSKNAATNQQQLQQQTNILNVAEMLLHGVADDEILDIWLRSIACQEFAKNFLDAGYDMPTISRITPQDLTAIGITDPAKRLKILTEIKKLNLQDGIPNFKPANLSHWLSLLRLDSLYHKSLCDQQIDTIEKTCQLTWEDFEDLGITKLGHQKRLLLAIERMKEIETDEARVLSKPMSEPIYDTNPSQILLVASAENHSMNGPIMNKQSSTSELSSTGSGSMHSLYSANSIQYQPTYATLPTNHQPTDQQLQQHNHSPQQQHQKQVIYSQPPSQIMQPTQQIHMTTQHQLPNVMPMNHQHQQQQTHHTPQHYQNSHYQAIQPITNPSQYTNNIYDRNNLNVQNKMAPFMNRQSLGQLPFSALANLPKHQQQLLQQCSIYATLSRQPQRAKQPPPPVPVRTNSLKSNSLIDEETNKQQSQQSIANNQSSTLSSANTQTNSTSNLYRSGTRVTNRNQFNPQTLLTKNKSFSGNACMDAARARFLNRNSQQQQQISNLPQQMQPMPNYNNGGFDNPTQNIAYGINPMGQNGNLTNMHPTLDGDNLSIYSRQSIPATMSLNQANTFNLKCQGAPATANYQIDQRNTTQLATNPYASGATASNKPAHADDYDVYSDTNSTKSLILPPTNVTNSPVNSHRQTSLSQESGSSQTLYNSASSGSTDQNINVCNFSRSGDMASRHSTTSNSTLNDVNLILEQQSEQHRANHSDQQNNTTTRANTFTKERYNCNATTGKDDDFPPPPSPLSLTDSDEHNLHSLNLESNFTDVSQRLMTFRVGI